MAGIDSWRLEQQRGKTFGIQQRGRTGKENSTVSEARGGGRECCVSWDVEWIGLAGAELLEMGLER